jgi:NhaP-type Na+/H+ or K+/H+ antiporter
MKFWFGRAKRSGLKKSYTKPFGVYKQFNLSNRLSLLWADVSKQQFLDKLLILIGLVVEYAFGIYIGYAIGWLIGLYVGHSYVEHFGPVYLHDLSVLSYQKLTPYVFARNVAVIGMAVGSITIAIANSKSFKKITS